MKIVADIDIPYLAGVFEPYAEVVYLKGSAISKYDVADADALIVRTRTQCDEALLEGSKVRLIATATIGCDHIDTGYCHEAGIEVATSAGSNARGVLQWVGAVLEGASRKMGFTPEEKIIGVVGVGNVGRLVAEYAAAWGFRVLCCDPLRKENGFVSLGEIARSADIITFHVPLTCDGDYPTFEMAGHDFFKHIKRGALIINSSRGEVVDEDELAASIVNGAHAAIDTWVGEPFINKHLLDQTLFATPHIAGYTVQGKANATAMAVKAVARKLDLPLKEWSASHKPSVPREISWEELGNTIGRYFDIDKQTRLLKNNYLRFESIRCSYKYRSEYF